MRSLFANSYFDESRWVFARSVSSSTPTSQLPRLRARRNARARRRGLAVALGLAMARLRRGCPPNASSPYRAVKRCAAVSLGRMVRARLLSGWQAGRSLEVDMALNKSTGTPASSAPPRAGPRALRPTAGPARVGSSSAASAAFRSAFEGARFSAYQNTRSTTSGTRVSTGGAGSGVSSAGGTSRSGFGSASNTKNRSCGFNVDPISDRGLATSTLPRNLAKPLPAMS